FVLAPAIARELQRIASGRYRDAVMMAVCVAALAPVSLLARPLVLRYRADNPLYPPETVFQRMVVTTPFFPTGATEFVKANEIVGRVLNSWAWEGYLRWHETRLLMFAGSRAQQVYDAETY